MKLRIHPTLIFRTPKFSYQSDLATCWDALKLAISISSDAFYQTIKDVKADELQDLPPKVFFTVWKYFNRARYRSTPYGTFANFSILHQAIKPGNEKIIIDEEQIIHDFIDWPYKNNIQIKLRDSFEKNCFLFSNSSYYPSINSIRYIACTDGLFELAEVNDDVFVKQILDACLKPIQINDLIKKLNLADDEKDSLFSLLEDMHGLQLIFTDYDPNIIGEDFFKRIGVEPAENLPGYLIAERETKSGNMDEQVLKAIPGLINLLQKILPVNERDALKQFVNRFKKKFGQGEVPLLLALDPEMGVGYDELEQTGQDDDFIAQFNSKQVKKIEHTDDLKSVLKSALTAQSFDKGKTLFLNQMPFNLNEKPAKLPNSFSMLMSVADDLICIDQIGGSTANTLSGRFTMASRAVENYCRNTAEIEQGANPDVLFFDVAYIVETNVDNINRRKLVYDYQLSLLNFDTSADPLTLNDILISVQGREVILRSKRLNKRIIPKMASAYNYIRSDLSIFRLLCDLQHQGIQTSLSLTIESLFPDLDYYPRIQYQNIILSTAKWKVRKDAFFVKNETVIVEQCRSYLQHLGISRYFKAGLADQTLCFDMQNDEDLSAFIQFMQKQKNIYLEEAILPVNSLVQDEKSKPYLAQFILNLYHQDKIYNKSEGILADLPKVKQFFLPGSEWLYFEIYCHQQRSDQILGSAITFFLDANKEHIKSWFFIRYNENGDHIRLRVLLHDPEKGQKLTAALSDYLEQDMAIGMVADLQLKTYKRETERYGNDLIEAVETHFCTDSVFVLSLLDTQPNTFNKYKLCSDLIDKIQQAEIFDYASFTKIIKLMSDSFNGEHQLEPADFKQLNNRYQGYRKAEIFMLNSTQIDFFNLFAQSFINILRQCNPEKRVKLFSDLIHMHVNRLFNKDQRVHEMVMYYFLLKDMQRKNAIHNLNS